MRDETGKELRLIVGNCLVVILSHTEIGISVKEPGLGVNDG